MQDLKRFISEIVEKVNTESDRYQSEVQTLVELNERERELALKYQDNAKESMSQLAKERQELKCLIEKASQAEEKRQKLNKQNRIKLNETKNLIAESKANLSMKDDNEDFVLMTELLHSLKFEVDITKNLNEEEKQLLAEMMTEFSIKTELNKETENEVAEDIINHIELVVNKNYNNGKVGNIGIMQIDDSRYEFDGHPAELYLKDGELLVKDEEVLFEAWLLSRFGLKKSVNEPAKEKGLGNRDLAKHAKGSSKSNKKK